MNEDEQRTTLSFFLVAATASFAFLAPLQADAEEMTFELVSNGGNCVGCEWVAAQGEITAGTPAVFEAFLAQHGKIYDVSLNSPGGDLRAGLRLGEMIRQAGARTSVAATKPMDQSGPISWHESDDGTCASACAFAFMGGVDRSVGTGSLLGMHRFYSDDANIDTNLTQQAMGETLLFTISMGIDPNVIVAASSAAPEEMYWFSEAELEEFNLDTYAEKPVAWRLEPYGEGLVLTTEQEGFNQRKVAVTLFCRRGSGWRVLISEDDPGYGETLISNAFQPRFRIGGTNYDLGTGGVEFEKLVNGTYILSLHAPTRLASAGGESMSFDPDLGRVHGQLYGFGFDLPAEPWLSIIDRNCL